MFRRASANSQESVRRTPTDQPGGQRNNSQQEPVVGRAPECERNQKGTEYNAHHALNRVNIGFHLSSPIRGMGLQWTSVARAAPNSEIEWLEREFAGTPNAPSIFRAQGLRLWIQLMLKMPFATCSQQVSLTSSANLERALATFRAHVGELLRRRFVVQSGPQLEARLFDDTFRSRLKRYTRNMV